MAGIIRKVIYLEDFLEKKKGDIETLDVSDPQSKRNLEDFLSVGIVDIVQEKPKKHKKLVAEQNAILSNLPIVSASQIMKRKKDNRFIVERFLHPKTVNMLYSPPATFKSLLTMDLCLSIAGGDFWLNMKTKKGKVLILDKENPDSSLRDRLISIVSGHNWKRKYNTKNLHFLIRQGSINDPKFLVDLSTYVKENDIQLVVFDTIRRFSDYEENSSDAINKLYTAFQQIINGTNAAVLFLHHARKEGNTYRGSVDLLGQVDACYRIERQPNTGKFKIICEKSRTGEIDEIDGEIDFLEDKITIQRKDVDETIENDRYQKFNDAKTFTINSIGRLCNMVGESFVRFDLLKELDVENADRQKENRISGRTIERVLFYLVKKRYLAKTGVKGEYKRLFSIENGISKAQE